MRKVGRWLKHNWFAAAIGAVIMWFAHYSVETFVVTNVARLIGIPIPNMAVV